jgi:glycerol-3-phosphate acyltransferase PlsY
MLIARAATCSLLAFFLGAIPFGMLFARARGIDLRRVGSGNIGATNASRALGRRVGLLVLLCDAAKAYLPVVIGRRLFGAHPAGEWIACGLGLAALLGHLYSPFLRFHGGKGVACGLGVFLALEPLTTAFALALWVALYLLTRVASVGSLGAALLLVLLISFRHAPTSHVVLVLIVFLLIVASHRSNIARLLRREESKV